MPADFGYRGGASSQPQYDESVLLLEDCEGSNKWTAAGTGADYVNSFDASFCYFGTKGWKMRTRVTTPAANDYVSCARTLTYPTIRKLILRGRMCVSDVSLIKEWYGQVDVYNGIRDYRVSLKVTPNTPKVEYMNSAGAYVAMADLAYPPIDNDWFVFELALDLVALKYIHAAFGGTRVDLSAQSMYNVAADTGRVVVPSFYLLAIGAAQAEVGMDSIYLGAYDQL